MRTAIVVAAVLLLSSGPAQAQPASNPPKVMPYVHRTVETRLIPVGLTERAPAATRGQIAVCANLAALRALDAKAAGADYPAQDRTLDVTFVLCMAGPQTAD